MEGLAEAIAAAILVSGIIIVVFIIAKYNYLIKKAMIKNGLTPASKSRTTQLLEFGSVFLGFGLGLLISTIFVEMDLSEDAMDLLVWGTICICGALGLMLAHVLRRRFAQK